MTEPVLAADDMSEFVAHLARCKEFSIDQVLAEPDWRLRLRKIRRAYTQFQLRVDAGLGSWMNEEAYTIADWASLFTPIEQAAWHDIRGAGLPMWPQLPVSRFYVDFGNPIVKVALECDGKKFHDPAIDAVRDKVLGAMGWTVYRAPGWQCWHEISEPLGFEDWDREDQNEFYRAERAKTLSPIISQISGHFKRIPA